MTKETPELFVTETMNRVASMQSQQQMVDSLCTLTALSIALLREMQGDDFLNDFLKSAADDKTLMTEIKNLNHNILQ